MADPRQHRAARPLLTRQFRYVAAVLLSTAFLCIGSATAWAEESIVLDFVRHAQSVANVTGTIDTTPPGTELTPLGEQQAQALANVLGPEGPFSGIFASTLIRTSETAAPLAGLLDVNVPLLSGLNEISDGVFSGFSEFSPAGLLWGVGPLSWVSGNLLVPMLAPGSTDVNGVVFDQRFTDAVQTIFDNSLANPVDAADGKITDVAFSSQGAITTWALMNVNNPDLQVILSTLLDTGSLIPNTGQVVMQGNPQDGWTLLSWDGMPVPPASLLTQLFVDVRDLIQAPQIAAWNIWVSLFSGSPTTILDSIKTGISEIGTATVTFVRSVIQQLLDAVGGSGLAGLSTDLTNLLPTSATELPGLLSGDLGTMLGSGLAGLSTDLTNLLPTSATELPALLSGDLGTMLTNALMSLL